jgi:DNA (cytosine-5)-methyltransferase 1
MRNIYWIDLFCGAGGTTTGIHLAGDNIKVLACVNHDADAIKAHKFNHPECIHFTEDIRDWKVIIALQSLVSDLRKREPDAIINIWASLECTHFSKAKGGMSRDADSRTLASHLYKYIERLDPDYLYLENVREFITWGPLDKNAKPIKTKKGIFYDQWTTDIKFYGFDYEYAILNSADFGAYTSRERYFGIFAKIGMPISFPTPTHAKKKKAKELNLKEWKPVRDLLNLKEEGANIFSKTKMGKKRSDKTYARIYKGLQKFVGKRKPTEEFLTSYYGNGSAHPTKAPLGTITTKDRYALNFINYDYSKPTFSNINAPAGSITTIPKHNLVKVSWTFDTQFNAIGRSIDRPSQTLIARMDKKPIYLSTVTRSKGSKVLIFKDDTDIVRKIKTFMRLHNISSIKTRMLFLEEYKDIQGFPSDYKLIGSKTNQLKFIGNSVVPLVAQKLAQENKKSINSFYSLTLEKAA